LQENWINLIIWQLTKAECPLTWRAPERGTGSLENAGCGKHVDYTGPNVNGKHRVCGKKQNKNSVCKQISSLSVALDEMPTATCEPSEIAT